MSDLILRTATRTQLRTQELSARLVVIARTAAQRLEREQTGQDMVEYAGVLFVVAAIISAVALSGVGTTIADGISSLVKDILGGKAGS